MPTSVIRSTADLTPEGILGYAKALSALAQFLGGSLAVLVPYFVPGSTWAIWVGGAIAVLGFIGTYQFPNRVVPVTVVAVDPLTGVVSPPDPV